MFHLEYDKVMEYFILIYYKTYCLFFFTLVKLLMISIFKFSFPNIFTKFSSTFIIVYLYQFF